MTTETDEGAGKATTSRVMAAAQAAFEKHVSFVGFSHPRLGMRTATWQEIHDAGRQEWVEIAQAASSVANADILAERDNLRRQKAEIINLLRRLQPCLVTSHGDNTEFTYCIPYTLNDDIREAIASATIQPETAPDRNTP